MVITGLTSRRKSNRRQSHRRIDDIEIIKIIGEGEKGREVTVHNEAVPRRKERSTLSWFEELAIEWSEIFIPKRQKRNPQEGDLL